MREKDPEFFNRLVNQQNPEYLWIGCSDSRVPANQILGLAPGEIFVQRNVGNQAMHTDLNLMACLEYAVKSLKVKTIILCGHYNCGAVRAALQLPHCTPGLVNCWISDIRECRNQAEKELIDLDPEQQLAKLCELNVLRQVFKIATSPVVASAWAEGQELHLYGVIYDVADGHLRKLAGPISSDDGYVRDMKDFVARGLQLIRCPNSQRLRVSIQDESLLAAAVASVAARSAGNSDGGVPAQQEDLDAFATPPSFSFASSPSEVISSINNINLAESIAKHKQWAVPARGTAGEKAAAAAAVTAAVGAQTDTDGDEAQAAC